jgi:CheY-like chemotaxis protein/anti-sigma regulatory factor (Ser/Thr protein kinase)
MVTILVVDDSAMDRRLAGSLLKKRAGYEPVYATNGREALELVEKSPPDIVVTDMQMPEMDGLELVQAIRRGHPAIPVILMTAHGSEEIAVRALQKGAASYVPKRGLAQALAATVENVLELARAAETDRRVLDGLAYTETVFRLDNDVSVIPPVVGHLEASLTQLKICDETALLQIGVALREALVNAIVHGNLEVSSELRENDGRAYQELVEERRRQAPYRDRRVGLTARVTRSDVVYVITDEGPGFDPSALPDPTDVSQLEKASGRGLMLIRTFMDEVFHNDRGNEITLLKRLAPPSQRMRELIDPSLLG